MCHRLEQKQTRLNVIILDCCRVFVDWDSESSGVTCSSFAKAGPQKLERRSNGTLAVYACKRGEKTIEGKHGHGQCVNHILAAVPACLCKFAALIKRRANAL